MRKITHESTTAFMNDQSFSKGNTQVVVSDGCASLFLFGNCIATKSYGEITISTCGWKTNTTKERLNGIPGVLIQQKKGVWYLNGISWDGKPKKLRS